MEYCYVHYIEYTLWQPHNNQFLIAKWSHIKFMMKLQSLTQQIQYGGFNTPSLILVNHCYSLCGKIILVYGLKGIHRLQWNANIDQWVAAKNVHVVYFAVSYNYNHPPPTKKNPPITKFTKLSKHWMEIIIHININIYVLRGQCDVIHQHML